MREGAPPAVDGYIDDGRHGEYQHQPVHWNNQSVWNRRFADSGTLHEDPWLNRTNFAYVRVRNRGTQTANDVVVRAFHTDPGAGLTWPDDFVAMTTAQLTAPPIPPGGELTVGPTSLHLGRRVHRRAGAEPRRLAARGSRVPAQPDRLDPWADAA